jgi:AmmeMemoRadiSam system protein B/AmmeMemoRadiSam system protein A
MKPASILPFVLSFMISFGCLPSSDIARAEKIRKAAKAGIWYPADPDRIKQDIHQFTNLAKKSRISIPANKQIKALILPHAGYVYSGWTAAHASFVLQSKEFSKIILIGPDHYVGFKNGAISEVDAYETPLGSVKLHPDAEKLRRQSDLFDSSIESDLNEHSLEMVLLFLQAYIKSFQLVPITVGPTEIDRIARSIDMIVDSGSLVVVSADLSHYLTHGEAVERDRETIQGILKLDSSVLSKTKNRSCGAIPISILIAMARKHEWQPLLLHYSNSGDTAGGRSRVVGYSAIAFFGDDPMQNKSNSENQLSVSQGDVLVQFARQTLMEKLGQSVPPDQSEPVKAALKDECFHTKNGTFVTLKIDGQLRGCIGTLAATEPLSEGVRRNAINAAFHDPRFTPLTASELAQVEIEVSILTEPQPLDYVDGPDLLNKLRAHIDGVIIGKGHASATFLPQVWEQLPKPEDFLSHLCMKAGLSSNAWRDTKLEVQTYQVQYFEESN